LELRAYLTMPPGRGDKNLPMVVMPHGGPFARDSWGYDAWAQFLASKGYVVLQPNFRGSTGFGRDFVAKGIGQWGRGMQDDIDDGVKWLAAKGVVDPRR
ncbi:alpha/beta hydrolase family protein, partial [Acinetobacter baumannii]